MAPVRAADEGTDKKAFEELRAKVDPPQGGDARKAVDAYTQWIQAKPDLNPWIGAQACARVSELRHSSLKETQVALEVIDWATKRYETHPAVTVVLNARAKILLAEKRPEEVGPLYEANWERFAVSGRAQPCTIAVWYWCKALEAEGKQEKIAPLLRKSLLEFAPLLDESAQSGFDGMATDWIYMRLNQALIEEGKDSEAVRWAKLRFALCKFEQARIERATRMLASALTAKDPSQRTARAFAEAQADATKPNPLADVKLPDADPELIKAQLTRLQGSWPGTVHMRVSVLLRSGDLLQGMREARKLMIDQPNLPDGAMEVCRCLKAAYLNLKACNDFINYVKTGQGENPLEQFFKEQQAKPGGTGLFAPPPPNEVAALAGVRPARAGTMLVQTINGGYVQVGATPSVSTALPAPVSAKATAIAYLPLGGGAGIQPVAGAGLTVVSPVALAPVTAGATLEAVGTSTVAQALVLTQLAAGKISPEDAWQSGGLPAESVVSLLQRGSDTKTTLALAGVLVGHYPERLDAEPRLNATARMALADYFASQKDKRAVDYYEGLLAEIREKVDGKVPALEKLALHYDRVGEWRKAVDTYLRADQYSVSNRCLAAFTQDAARVCLRRGDEARWLELSQKVPAFGYDWDTGAALVDQAEYLQKQGKCEEARAVLQRYSGDGPIGVVVCATLGYTFYSLGDFENARKHCEASLARLRAAQGDERVVDVQPWADHAARCLRWIALWEKKPVYCEPAEVMVASLPATVQVCMRSYRGGDVRISPLGPGLRVSAEEPWRRASPYYWEKRLTLEVGPQTPAGREWSIVARQAGLDGELRVPIRAPILGH